MIHTILALASLGVFLLIVLAVKSEPDDGWGMRLYILTAAMIVLAGASLVIS